MPSQNEKYQRNHKKSGEIESYVLFTVVQLLQLSCVSMFHLPVSVWQAFDWGAHMKKTKLVTHEEDQALLFPSNPLVMSTTTPGKTITLVKWCKLACSGPSSVGVSKNHPWQTWNVIILIADLMVCFIYISLTISTIFFAPWSWTVLKVLLSLPELNVFATVSFPSISSGLSLFNKNADGSSTQIGSASADFHMTYSIYYAWQNYYSAPASQCQPHKSADSGSNLFIQASVLSGLGMVPVYTSPVYIFQEIFSLVPFFSSFPLPQPKPQINDFSRKPSSRMSRWPPDIFRPVFVLNASNYILIPAVQFCLLDVNCLMWGGGVGK